MLSGATWWTSCRASTDLFNHMATENLKTEGKFTTAVLRQGWVPLQGDGIRETRGGAIFCFCFLTWVLLNSVFVQLEQIH